MDKFCLMICRLFLIDSIVGLRNLFSIKVNNVFRSKLALYKIPLGPLKNQQVFDLFVY